MVHFARQPVAAALLNAVTHNRGSVEYTNKENTSMMRGRAQQYGKTILQCNHMLPSVSVTQIDAYTVSYSITNYYLITRYRLRTTIRTTSTRYVLMKACNWQ